MQKCEEAPLRIISAGRGLKVNILKTLEAYGILISDFAYLYIFTNV